MMDVESGLEVDYAFQFTVTHAENDFHREAFAPSQGQEVIAGSTSPKCLLS